MPWFLMTSATGEVYMEYKIRPNSEPSGMPQVSLRFDDFSSHILTNSFDWINDFIQDRVLPDILQR